MGVHGESAHGLVTGWSMILSSLKTLLETGEAMPLGM
jgi:hypothetical protein